MMTRHFLLPGLGGLFALLIIMDDGTTYWEDDGSDPRWVSYAENSAHVPMPYKTLTIHSLAEVRDLARELDDARSRAGAQ